MQVHRGGKGNRRGAMRGSLPLFPLSFHPHLHQSLPFVHSLLHPSTITSISCHLVLHASTIHSLSPHWAIRLIQVPTPSCPSPESLSPFGLLCTMGLLCRHCHMLLSSQVCDGNERCAVTGLLSSFLRQKIPVCSSQPNPWTHMKEHATIRSTSPSLSLPIPIPFPLLLLLPREIF